MRHYLRDRCRAFGGARSVIELLQRGATLQRRRELQGLEILDDRATAEALGCSLQRWQEAQALQACLRIASLDQPGTGPEPDLPLVEQLSDQQAPTPYGWLERCELRRRLWKGLKTLSARAAQRHYQQACAQVRQQLA